MGRWGQKTEIRGDILYGWSLTRSKLKKNSVTKNCSDLSLFEQIVQVVSKFLKILGLLPRISKVFLDHKNNFFHSKSEQFC